MNAAIRSLYIRTNLSTSSILDSSVGGGYSSILARVPIDVGSGGIITISPSDGSVHKLIIKVREITIIGVRLTDQRNRLIDLNGLDWDVSFQFDFIENPELKVPIDKRLEIELKKYEKLTHGRLNGCQQAWFSWSQEKSQCQQISEGRQGQGQAGGS